MIRSRSAVPADVIAPKAQALEAEKANISKQLAAAEDKKRSF